MIEARPWMFGVLCALAGLYEVLALYQGKGATISEIVWAVSRYHPLVPFAFGLLVGHFFWQAVSRTSGQ